MKPWQRRSSASVVTPGTTCGVMKSSTSASSRPALRMASKAAAGCSLIRRSSGSTGRACASPLAFFIIIAQPTPGRFGPSRQRQRPSDLYSVQAHVASIAQGLDPGRPRVAEGQVVDRVEIGGDAEALAVAALDDIEQDRPVSRRARARELRQVAGAARRDAVREFGPAAAPQMHVLDLDIADGLS